MRLIKINVVLLRTVLTKSTHGRGVSLRKALEALGPVFIKFGQLLSTRLDLLPPDIAHELAKLQDQVPPFPGSEARTMVESAFGKSIETIFSYFDLVPLASASVAQVHAAVLHDGSDVVVKVLRPRILKTIQQDVRLMYFFARLITFCWPRVKRLKLVALVAEFEQTIIDELDLVREAGNASQLARNFQHSPMLYVPKIHWPWVASNVMVMERIYGLRISDGEGLRAAKTNFKHLAEYGVEIFFTQVLRDSFFHADMHPGNVFVDVTNPEYPKYVGVDFGIMGTLSPEDQHYLAANLLAFFKRDYRRVALLHIESGWVSAQTRVDQFESAIRSVCEPIFEKPLKDISFGHLLLHLFRTAERFDMCIQPQLLLLQKTLLGVEGLGRQLYPELDLWQTAKPFLEKWMKEQYSVRSMLKKAINDWPLILDNMLTACRRSARFKPQSALAPALSIKSSRSFFTKTRAVLIFLLGAVAALTFAFILRF